MLRVCKLSLNQFLEVSKTASGFQKFRVEGLHVPASINSGNITPPDHSIPQSWNQPAEYLVTLGACIKFVIAHLNISLCLSLRNNSRSSECTTYIKNNRNLKHTLRLCIKKQISEGVPKPNPVPESNTPSQHCTCVWCPIPIPTWFLPLSDTPSPSQHGLYPCLTPHPHMVCTCVWHLIPTLFIPMSKIPFQHCLYLCLTPHPNTVPVSDTPSQHCTYVQHPIPTLCWYLCLTPHHNIVCTRVQHPIPTLFVPVSDTPSQDCLHLCPMPHPTSVCPCPTSHPNTVPVSDTPSQDCLYLCPMPHPNSVCPCPTSYPNTVCTCVQHPIPTLFVPMSDTPS